MDIGQNNGAEFLLCISFKVIKVREYSRKPSEVIVFKISLLSKNQDSLAIIIYRYMYSPNNPKNFNWNSDLHASCIDLKKYTELRTERRTVS